MSGSRILLDGSRILQEMWVTDSAWLSGRNCPWACGFFDRMWKGLSYRLPAEAARVSSMLSQISSGGV